MDELKRLSEYGGFGDGDYVTRYGDDVQLVKDMDEDGYSATFVCVVAPRDGWCSVGEEEVNLCSRYSRVRYLPSLEIAGRKSGAS